MTKPVSIALALVVLAFSSAHAGTDCAVSFKSFQCRAQIDVAKAPIDDKWKLAVLCCCKRHSGSECCTKVAQCGEKIPGCFCASPSVPGTVQIRRRIQVADPIEISETADPKGRPAFTVRCNGLLLAR